MACSIIAFVYGEHLVLEFQFPQFYFYKTILPAKWENPTVNYPPSTKQNKYRTLRDARHVLGNNHDNVCEIE